MARLAVADGVTVQACTPHIYPGVYNNSGPDIRLRVAALQEALDEAGIPLRLVTGADVHVAPDLPSKLANGDVLSLNDTRYVLLETPHHVLPPRVEEIFFSLTTAGYVPILTHPERMTWIEQRYDLIKALAHAGTLMQITSGALLGRFGTRARYWSERMLDEGLVQIVASDAHDTIHRPPILCGALDALSARVGEEEAMRMIWDRPYSILANYAPEQFVHVPPPERADDSATGRAPFWRSLFSRGGR